MKKKDNFYLPQLFYLQKMKPVTIHIYFLFIYYIIRNVQKAYYYICIYIYIYTYEKIDANRCILEMEEDKN